MVEYIIVSFVASIVGFCFGWSAREYAASVMLRRLEQKWLEQLEEKKRSQIEVEVERHGDDFFIYHSNTGEFLTQGKTFDEIYRSLELKYPDTRFVASADRLRELGLVE